MAWGKPVAAAKAVKIDRPKIDVKYREDIITLDFETYYDDAYSLSKLSYTEYIRNKLFEPMICGVKRGTKKIEMLVGVQEMRRYFAKIDWANNDLLAHNTPFDGFIMSDFFGIVPRRYLDTLAMARGLHGNDTRADLDSISLFYGGKGKAHADALVSMKGKRLEEAKKDPAWAKYKEYCADDVDECYRIYHRMLEKFPPLELTKIDIFVRAFCDPILEVDRKRVSVELKREIKEMNSKIMLAVGTPEDQAEIVKIMGEKEALEFAKKQIGSSPKFAELLEGHGVKPPMKPSPKPGKDDIYAFSKTDEDFLALREHPEKIVRDLVEARLVVKSTGNKAKAQRFLDASENGKKLPVLLSYYAAHTGRPGGGNKMNMLNLERGGELRKSILAPKGYKIAVSDSGQIEARVAMWLADQMDALEEFAIADKGLDRDPYCKFASDVYGYMVTKENKDERHVGKVSKLSLQYQAGPPRFQTMMALGALGGKPMFIEIAECQRIVYLFRRKHPKLVAFWAKCTDIIRDMVRGREGEWKCIKWEKERIWLPNGMCLKYPGLREHQHEAGTDWTYMRKGAPSKIYGGLLTENIVQALANVIITEQMTKIAEKYRIVMMTYDENAWLVTDKDAKKGLEFGLNTMMVSPSWAPDLPLFAEGVVERFYAK